MAVSVITNEIQYSFFNWDTSYNRFKLKDKAWILVPFMQDGKKKRMLMTFDRGYICDGLSVPKCLRWFLKNWDPKNELYNLSGVVHDALYAWKGFKIFNREECDDFFRGLLRASGQDRKHASIADFFLGLFAGTHWGNDDFQCKDKVSIQIS